MFYVSKITLATTVHQEIMVAMLFQTCCNVVLRRVAILWHFCNFQKIKKIKICFYDTYLLLLWVEKL